MDNLNYQFISLIWNILGFLFQKRISWYAFAKLGSTALYTHIFKVNLYQSNLAHRFCFLEEIILCMLLDFQSSLNCKAGQNSFMYTHFREINLYQSLN